MQGQGGWRQWSTVARLMRQILGWSALPDAISELGHRRHGSSWVEGPPTTPRLAGGGAVCARIGKAKRDRGERVRKGERKRRKEKEKERIF